MATLIEVEDAVAALLVSSTGRQVIQGRVGEGPAPSQPAAMWSLDRIELQDFTRTEYDADQIIISPNTPLEFIIEMIGGNAMADAVRFGLSLRQSQRTADLYQYCGLSGITPPQNLAGVELGDYRQRVQLRLTLFTALTLTAPIELIEQSCLQVIEQSKEFDETYCVIKGECR